MKKLIYLFPMIFLLYSCSDQTFPGVEPPPNPKTEFVYEIAPQGPLNIDLCEGSIVTLIAPEADAYLWLNGDTSQSITVSTGGRYDLAITNSNETESIWINLKETTGIHANVFTPNGDGAYDQYILTGFECYYSFYLQIYDLKNDGQLLFETGDRDATWNGANSKGKPLPVGSYPYLLEGYLWNGQFVREKGNIELIR